MKKGLTQICLVCDSSIRDTLQLCKEIGYQGLEILLTESGKDTFLRERFRNRKAIPPGIHPKGRTRNKVRGFLALLFGE